MEAAQTKLWRAVRREVSRTSRVGPSDSSAASVSGGDEAGLSPEFVATAHAVNAALARAVADEVEEQLTDVLMCLGEESTKARILEHALTRFDVHVPRLLREAGYSPENSPPGSRGASPAARDAAARDAPFSGGIPGDPGDPGDGDGRSVYAHLLPPRIERSGERGREAARNEGVSPEPGLAALRALRLGARGVSGRDAAEEAPPRVVTVDSSAHETVAETAVDGHRSGKEEPLSPVEAVAAEARSVHRVEEEKKNRQKSAAANATANGVEARFATDGRERSRTTTSDIGTPPEEEGARVGPASVSEDWDTSEEDSASDDLGYSSFSSESSRGGSGGGTHHSYAYVTDAQEDPRAVSRRARARARAPRGRAGRGAEHPGGLLRGGRAPRRERFDRTGARGNERAARRRSFVSRSRRGRGRRIQIDDFRGGRRPERRCGPRRAESSPGIPRGRGRRRVPGDGAPRLRGDGDRLRGRRRGVVPARRGDGPRRRARRAAGADDHAGAPEALDGDLRVHVLDAREGGSRTERASRAARRLFEKNKGEEAIGISWRRQSHARVRLKQNAEPRSIIRTHAARAG